jgi:uncharacterized protein (TIGR03435 family)
MAIGMRIIWASLIFGSVATAQSVEVGQAAPKLTLGTVVQGHLDEQLPAKARVLEFWATWCPPCRKSLPQLNELADRFKDRPIDFISITSESCDIVNAFLKDHPMRGIVALDPNFRMFKSYGAGLPTTVLITSSGRIAAATTEPDLITPAMLEDLISGRPIDVPAVKALGARTPFTTGMRFHDVGASVRVVITPVMKDSGWSAEEDQFESSLPELLSFAYEISPPRIIIKAPLKDRIYAVQAWVPPSHADLLRVLFQNALIAAAGFDAKRERRLVDVLVVTGMPGKLHESHRDPPANTAEFGHYVSDGAELDLLRQQIEAATGKPVIMDHPGGTKVQYELRWDTGKLGSFEAALIDQLGLTLQPEQREIEVLVVEERRPR